MLPSKISKWSVPGLSTKIQLFPDERKACAEHNQKRDQANAKIDRQIAGVDQEIAKVQGNCKLSEKAKANRIALEKKKAKLENLKAWSI